MFGVTATFTGAALGLAADDITVTNGAVSNVVALSSSVYTFDITPDGGGAIMVEIEPDVVATGNLGSNVLIRELDLVYGWDLSTWTFNDMTAIDSDTLEFDDAGTCYAYKALMTIGQRYRLIVVYDHDATRVVFANENTVTPEICDESGEYEFVAGHASLSIGSAGGSHAGGDRVNVTSMRLSKVVDEINIGPGQTYETIAAGIAAAQSGDVVFFHSDTYTEQLTGVPSGIAGYPTIVRNAANATPIFRYATPGAYCIHIVTADYVTLQGLHVDSAANQTGGIAISNGSPGNLSNIIVDGCTIYDTGNEVGDTLGFSLLRVAGLTIRNCTVSDTNSHGIYVSTGCSDVIVEKNCVYRPGKTGIVSFGPSMGGVIIRRNYIEDAGRNVVDTGTGIQVAGGTVLAYSNLISNPSWKGIGIGGGNYLSAVVANNTVVRAAPLEVQSGAYCSTFPALTTLIFVNNAIDYATTAVRTVNVALLSPGALEFINNYINGDVWQFFHEDPTKVVETDNVTGAPLNLVVVDKDATPPPGSPMIGGGIVVAGVSEDFNGNPFNNPPSVGAFETI